MNRRKDVLLEDFENIKILCQYLYMSEDHRVIVYNAIGVPLQIRMDENLRFWCKNLNFPDFPESCWNETLTLSKTLSVIEALRNEPAEEFRERFKNRWEEVKELCLINCALNIKG